MKDCTRAQAALILLAFFLLLLSKSGQAHFPAFYGKKFVRAEPLRQGEEPRDETASSAPVDEADADSFEQQVDALELIGGPYANSVVDPLSSLGRIYRDRGDYLQAEEFYKRALHIVRVNDGLYSERQIPLVRGLLNVHRAAGDMKALDDRYHYFFNLYGGGKPPYTSLRRRASLEYLRWQRAAHVSRLDGGGNRRLVELYLLNKEMLKAVAKTPDMEPSWYRELVLSQIRNLYLLLGNKHPGENFDEPGLDTPVEHKMAMLQRTGITVGRNLLQGLIEQSQQLDPIERASLYLELGDWFQWNNMPHNAEEEYVIVEQILLEAGEVGLLDQWLSAPIELPDNDAFRHPSQAPIDITPVVATVHFDISAKGQLTNVEVSTKEPDDETVGWHIKRMLKDTHFRPRFVSGHAESVEKLTRQYQLVQ